MKTIELDQSGIEIDLHDSGAGIISSTLKAVA